jgi:hypothetical protein
VPDSAGALSLPKRARRSQTGGLRLHLIRAFFTRHGRLIRQIALALVVSVAALLGINAGIEWAETRGYIDTYRGIDDLIGTVDEGLFRPVGGGVYETTRYARRSMIPSRFHGAQRHGWLAFVLGESFAMGSPWVFQGDPKLREGGIPSFLREDLSAMAPGKEVEVVNAAAAGENSTRVREIADRVLEFAPDVLVVATCNNEGALPPNAVTAALRKFGGIRLMTKLLVPPPAPQDRSVYTAQDPDTAAVRDNFRRNIEAIVEAAQKHGTHVLLCTMPANLLYGGEATVHVMKDLKVTAEPTLPCVDEGRALEKQGSFDAAGQRLRSCEDVEALRALGLMDYRLGHYDEARALLEQYVELQPQNRCRPSFNRIIRETAARFPETVRLVDLQRKAEELSPHGIPGSNLFLDYCHMWWEGYSAMEEEVLNVMKSAHWLPGAGAVTPPHESLAERWNLLKMEEGKRRDPDVRFASGMQ